MSILFHSQYHASTETVITITDNEVIVASAPSGLTNDQLEAWMDHWVSELAEEHIEALESVFTQHSLAA